MSRWMKGIVVAGHGVASGRNVESPYPSGTIAMQKPFFRDLGLDLDHVWPGTLNLSFSPHELSLRDADHIFQQVLWTDRHPPETFAFWRIQIRDQFGISVDGWIYYPDPQTKQMHWQPATVIELLAPHLENIGPGSYLEIRDPNQRILLIDGNRLRAGLLESIKINILALNNDFCLNSTLAEMRDWVRSCYPEALALPDRDLKIVWQMARKFCKKD